MKPAKQAHIYRVSYRRGHWGADTWNYKYFPTENAARSFAHWYVNNKYPARVRVAVAERGPWVVTDTDV